MGKLKQGREQVADGQGQCQEWSRELLCPRTWFKQTLSQDSEIWLLLIDKTSAVLKKKKK